MAGALLLTLMLMAPVSSPGASPRAASSLPVLGPAPDLDLPRLDTGSVTRARLLGDVTAVTFFAMKNPGCRATLADLAKVKKVLGTHMRIIVIDVGDGREELSKFFERKRAPPGAIVALDRDRVASRVWKASLPSTFVIDRIGRVRLVVHGRSGDIRARLVRVIRALNQPGEP